MTAGPTTQSVKSSALIDRRYREARRLVHQTNAADTAASTRKKRRLLRRLTKIQHDLSAITGLGEVDGFFELWKRKVMSDDR